MGWRTRAETRTGRRLPTFGRSPRTPLGEREFVLWMAPRLRPKLRLRISLVVRGTARRVSLESLYFIDLFPVCLAVRVSPRCCVWVLSSFCCCGTCRGTRSPGHARGLAPARWGDKDLSLLSWLTTPSDGAAPVVGQMARIWHRPGPDLGCRGPRISGGGGSWSISGLDVAVTREGRENARRGGGKAAYRPVQVLSADVCFLLRWKPPCAWSPRPVSFQAPP